jgi:23S rRNA pseudouridine1911/1915/1917 synthase
MNDDENDDTSGPGDALHAEAGDDAAGLRVDAWLARMWPELSRALIQGLIGQGKLRADGVVVTHASAKTRVGARYDLVLPPPAPADPTPENIPLSIVFEDAHLLVINKAAGMAMHPAPGAMTGTLVNALLHHCAGSLSGIGGVARPGIVHRIDKDTTGLVVVAKDNATHAGLSVQFEQHTLERAYYAVTRGAPHPRNGMIETRLARSPHDRKKMAVVRDPNSMAGKHAITKYWTIETYGQIEGAAAGRAAAALVECRLETGRTHQIRVHLAHIGAPLIGDQTYGKFRGLKLADAHETAEAAARDFPRQALHAAVLGFRHPQTGEDLRFEAPLPRDMEALLAHLRAL